MSETLTAFTPGTPVVFYGERGGKKVRLYGKVVEPARRPGWRYVQVVGNDNDPIEIALANLSLEPCDGTHTCTGCGQPVHLDTADSGRTYWSTADGKYPRACPARVVHRVVDVIA